METTARPLTMPASVRDSEQNVSSRPWPAAGCKDRRNSMPRKDIGQATWPLVLLTLLTAESPLGSAPSLFIYGHPQAKPDTQFGSPYLRDPASHFVRVRLQSGHFGSRIAFLRCSMSSRKGRP